MKKSTKPFAWPARKRAALSLTFDDARTSQIDCGLPILDEHGIRATFYVSFGGLEPRLDSWRQALADGHEIGNHSVTHPCSGNFAFAHHNPLEDYTLERMEEELCGANRRLKKLLGIRPQTFAYPCGQNFVGRGRALHSYVPLVARRFLAGRGYWQEIDNDPAWCDLAQLNGWPADQLDWAVLHRLVDQAIAGGRWLVLVGHDIGPEDRRQVFRSDVLTQLCQYCRERQHELWTDTVARIAAHVKRAQARLARATGSRKELGHATRRTK